MSVSRFAASYSRGFAAAVAQVLLGAQHAVQATALPAVEPPRTRKRFKTNVGAQPVSLPSERKRSFPETVKPSKKSRVPELPDLQLPQHFVAEQWQLVPQSLSSCAVRVGTCNIDDTNPVFKRIQELLPKVSIARMFVSRNVKQLQMPIGAPPPAEAPWRLSLGWSCPREAVPVILATERRRDLSRPELVRPCPEQELLLTIFFRAKPRDAPILSVPPDNPVTGEDK